MDYIAQPKDYWIAQGAITITLNALGNPNRIQGSVASGAAILCYIEGVDGLGYDNGHRFKTWPLSLSPTYFNSNTQKYVYAAIPRTATVGTQAVVVFPSEKLDVYGKNSDGAQVGSSDYYYIWLQGIISSSGDYGTTNRTWTEEIDFGKKGTDEDLYDDTDGEWYQYSKVSEIVTFLKNITMKAGTTFYNLYLGYKELTGVTTATTGEEYVDSETLVATPSYIHANYLRKNVEDTAEEQIGFLKGIWIGIKGLYEITAEGVAKFKSLFVDDITAQRMQVEDMQSSNYTGDGIADTGWRLTKDYNGHSKLTVDELYVRMKAVFESLEVKKEMVTGGNQIFSRAANVICRTDYYNSNNEQIGYSEVKVPWLLRGLQMVLSKRILSGIYAKVKPLRISIDDPAEIAYIRCYFLAEEGGRKVNNLWSVTGGNDLARCQTFNLNRSERKTYVDGEDVKLGNVFWWRKVIAVSSNSNPVEIDGKKYHYFDVSNQSGGYMDGSDLPCAGDEVSQWGNDANEARMNLVTIEVDGGVAIKAYEGIYTFDMSKCWYGGNPCKMNLSPQNEYRFTGRSFKIETEYGVRPVPVDIDVDWATQTKSRAEYAETGIAVGDLIVKNYYYDRVPHNGSLWLCLFTGNAYWARYAKYDGGVITYVTEDVFNTLTDSQKLYVKVNSRTGLADNQVCRRQEYATAQPGTNSAVWKEEVAKGQNGIDAQDVEWAYIRTKTNVAPIILNDSTYTDSNGNGYTADEHLPHVDGNANIENNEGVYECTDDPKGIDDTWKYEWEIKRSKGAASDGHRTWNYYQGSMTLHGNFAESAFIIDTDNDNDQFGTDSDSKVLVQQVRQTTVALYDGATPQTLTTLTATLTYEDGTSVPSGVATVTATAATGVVEVTVLQNSTANTHSEIRANITATCAKGSKQTVFTLRKVMGGAPGLNPIIYQMELSQKSFSYGRAADNSLIVKSNSVKVNLKVTEGNTSTIYESAASIPSGLTKPTYSWGFENEATPAAGHSGLEIGTSITIAPTDVGTHTKVWILLSTGDRETLPVVKDGLNGAIGDTPVQAYQWNSSPTTAPTPLPSGAMLGNWSFVAPARPSTAGEHFLWMTQSVKHTALDGTVTYDTWGAATRVSGNNGTNGKDAQYIYLKGTARDANNTITTTIPCVVNINGGTNQATTLRGLNLVTINRQTLAVVESINYDTYGQAAESSGTGITSLIDKLTALDNTVFVCLVSYDAVGWNSSLITALQNFGMGDLPYTQTGRYPFLFIGYKGLGNGNGLMRMHDVGAYTDVVELSAYVANGAMSAGADGEDAVSIDITPASLIVNQDLQNPDNLSSLTQTFVVKVYRGNVEQTVNSLSFESEVASTTPITTYKAFFLNNSGRNAGSGNINGSTLTLKKIGTYEVTEGTTTRNVYYDSMYADVTATYNTNKTIKARVRIYANLLGTWGEEVVGDAKTEVAKSLSYAYDPSGQNVVSLENMGKFIKSSTQDTSELRQKVYVDILNLTYPATSSSIDEMTVNVLAGTYKVAGEFNLANLPTGNGYLTFVGPGVNKTWDLTGGLVDSIDDEVTFTSAGVLTISAGDDISSGSAYDILNLAIYQSQDKIAKLEITANGITAEVNAIKAGKNLLSGTLTGSGWYKGTAGSRGIVVEAITDNDVDNGRISVGNKQYLLSTDCNFVAGKSYTISFQNDDVTTLYVGIAYGPLSASPFEYFAITKNSDGRFVHTFAIDQSNSYRLCIDFDENSIASANRYIYHPMFEEGTEATAFDAGDTEVSSQIKQEADNIELKVKNGLNEVGISILGNTNKVVAKAGTFEVHNSSGVKTFEIDNDGNLQGSGNAAFKGAIKNGEYTENQQTKYANELAIDGSGHLAKGNIRWNANGDTEFSGVMKAKSIYNQLKEVSGGSSGYYNIVLDDLYDTYMSTWLGVVFVLPSAYDCPNLTLNFFQGYITRSANQPYTLIKTQTGEWIQLRPSAAWNASYNYKPDTRKYVVAEASLVSLRSIGGSWWMYIADREFDSQQDIDDMVALYNSITGES